MLGHPMALLLQLIFHGGLWLWQPHPHCQALASQLLTGSSCVPGPEATNAV